MRLKVFIMLAVAACVTMAGCANTVAGAGEDISNAGRAISNSVK